MMNNSKLGKLLFVLSLTMIVSCTAQESAESETALRSADPEITFPELAQNMTIYEVNVRQFTPEGTLQAFSEHLPRLKDLGVEILWFMPIQPIGELNRKGTLGSYYSISDYESVNPEFGNLEDFKSVVQKAHELGLYIILDWVPNHTAWDNPWMETHREYYQTNEEGEVIYEADWTDIALLDLTNPETRKAMIEAMRFWIIETDIDGFRCDHAGHEIPLYFWEEAIPQLDQLKDLFWLAEWDEPKMHLQFDATYNWELHHLTNRVARGEENVDALRDFVLSDLHRYGYNSFRLNFTTNHDENAWNGTVFERYGDGHMAYATFMFTVTGIPMIYSGQEVGMDERLEFFEKDEIDWDDPADLQSFYKSLVSLRKENPALWSGKYGGKLMFYETGNERVIAYTRIRGSNKVSVLINLSDQPQQVSLDDDFTVSTRDYFTGETIDDSAGYGLDPFEYLVFINN